MNKREIKFREWDSASKRMAYPDTVNGMCTVIRLNGEITGTCFGELDGPEPYSTLLQYIGVKDSNGKEIYEGDIVDNHNDIGVVKYNETCARFVVEPVIELRKGEPRYNTTPYFGTVVGNIYENPEILL